jgi:hypothetical protein
MDGRKTVESRFAKRPCPPFERVEDGDVVLLKPVGRPVVGVCEVDKVWFYHLDPAALKSIKERFGKLICPVDGRFWSERQSKSVATLMLIKNVVSVSGIDIKKNDRRGWVTLESGRQQLLLP